jgi:hydroxyacylglutathione hydrolase
VSGFVERVHADQVLTLDRARVGPLATNSYLVSCARTGDAVLVDPGADEAHLRELVAGRRLVAIVLTHAHWDHVQAVDAVRDAARVPVVAHAAERRVWEHELGYLSEHGQWDWALERHRAPVPEHPPVPGWDGSIDVEVGDGATVTVGRVGLQVLHTPGHTPGSICLLARGHVLTGDTLFPGGPGLTGWPLSNFPQILHSIQTRLLCLDGATAVHPGHGAATVVHRERPHLEHWRERGW